jgi:hypothetical protein
MATRTRAAKVALVVEGPLGAAMLGDVDICPDDVVNVC